MTDETYNERAREKGDIRIIKSYVWHEDKCFFISTIDRNYSAMDGGRYAETMAWDFDWGTDKRGDIIAQGGDIEGFIRTHLNMCQQFHDNGEYSND